MHEDRFGKKITLFIKDNISNISLVLICLSYILYGMLTIQESGKTVAEIIASGLISAFAGFAIKATRMSSGLADGYNSQLFLMKVNLYGEKKAEISEYIEELTPFCSFKNEERLRQKQSEYLTQHAMKYELFANGYYDNDETKSKILEKTRAIKVYEYTPSLITNAYGNFKKEEDILNNNPKSYKIRKTRNRVIITIMIGLIWGYFDIVQNFNVGGIIYSSLQVALYLILGQLEYNDAYYFVTQTLRDKIDRVVSIIDEFQNIRKNHPNKFKLEDTLDKSYNILSKESAIE